MSTRDPHRFSNQLDDATTGRLIDRLESRGKDAVFTRLFDQYAVKLALPKTARVLELGCGTGVVSRALAGRSDFEGSVVGVDQSEAFIAAARRLAKDEGVGGITEFQLGDAHELEHEDESFDAVIAHTLISHVTDPVAVLREIARLVPAGGRVAIFDGDYASLTYAFADQTAGRQMDHALAIATFNNPLVMRDLPRLLPRMGFELTETIAEVVAEIGNGSYFKSFAETYAPLVSSGGLLPPKTVDHWLAAQQDAMQQGTFFASCNYYAYLATRK